MSPEISERAFEEAIECALLEHGPDACPGDATQVRETPPPWGDEPVPGGYRRRSSQDYDPGLCLLPEDVLDFLLATQPKEWEKLRQHHRTEVKERFLARLSREIERRVGQLDPMRTKAHHGRGEEQPEALSRIIAELNERFGLDLGPEDRVTLEQIASALDNDAGLDASARVNTRENVRLTFDPKVEDKIQEIVERNFELYRRITDDTSFGQAFKNALFDDYMRRHRRAEELLRLDESKILEFKASLRWSLKEDRKDDKHVTHAVLKTVAAFLNTEGGDLLIGIADDRSALGIAHDRLESDDKFMRHLAQVVRNGLGDRAGTG